MVADGSANDQAWAYFCRCLGRQPVQPRRKTVTKHVYCLYRGEWDMEEESVEYCWNIWSEIDCNIEKLVLKRCAEDQKFDT